jgi:outer membrane lipoprotein-sorting protein
LPQSAFAQLLRGEAAAKALAEVGRAVNAITRLQGQFRQTNPDASVVTGKFYLSRPGKVRFEYDAPSPLLLLADGRNVILHDRRLRTTDRYPLRQTPLYFLLKAKVDLAKDVRVTAVETRGDKLAITLTDAKREADGALSLIFNQPDMQLLEWTLRDRQGRATRVQLLDAQMGPAISAALFADPSPRRRFNSGG